MWLFNLDLQVADAWLPSPRYLEQYECICNKKAIDTNELI